MRVLIYLLMIVTATALSLGAGLLIGFQFHDAPKGLLLATAVTSPFLVMGPVTIGSIAGYWDHRASAESRKYLGWWFLGAVIIDVVAAVLIVLAALSTHAPAWVPVVLIGGSAVLLAVARPLGAVFRRTEAPIVDAAHDAGPDLSAVHRKVRTIIITFVAAAVLTTIGATVLTVFDRQSRDDLLRTVLLAGQLTFTATAVATSLVSLSFSRDLRDAGDRDLGRLRRFAKVVLRSKPLPLDKTEQRAAVRYARILPITLQFQLAFVGLLYTGLTFQFVSYAIRGEFGLLSTIFLPFMLIVLVVLIPLTLRRIRRARTYVDIHGAHPEEAPAEPSPTPLP